jgi:hypothetical protein
MGQLSSSAGPLDGQTHTYRYRPLTQLTTDHQSSGSATSWTPDGAAKSRNAWTRAVPQPAR